MSILTVVNIVVFLFIPIPLKVYLGFSLSDCKTNIVITLFRIIKIKPKQKKKKKKKKKTWILKAFKLKKIVLRTSVDITQSVWFLFGIQSAITAVATLQKVYLPKTHFVSSVVPITENRSSISVNLFTTFTIFKLLKELIYGKNISNS